MPWRPSEPGEVPTLGWIVLDWIEDHLAAPDRADYEPLILTREQAQFVLRFYQLDPLTGRRRIRRGVISRPRGWGKSPFLAAIACVEALGPVVPDGWDADGQPVGKPWSTVRTPLVQVAAVSERQTKNSWVPLLEMLRDGPVLDAYPGLEALDTFVNLPRRGRIEPVTSSPASIKGNKALFAILDQTEEWTRSNGGIRLSETMRINAAKLGGTTIESPNAYIPGEGSVAENSAAYWATIREGRARDDGLLYDHREAPPDTDPSNRDSLVCGLRWAYGDSSDHADGCLIHEPACAPGWSPIDRLVADFWDPSNDVQTLRADFLNQITHAQDSWLSQPEWAACADPTRCLYDGDMIALGFDGAIREDSTALVACRLDDAHLELLAIQEKPPGPTGEGWQVDRNAMNAAVDAVFERFTVVAFFADPPLWQDYVDKWTRRHGERVQVKASPGHPFEWWTQRPKMMADALERFHEAVVEKRISHDGNVTLARHMLHARRRVGRSGVTIAKEHPKSANKIDAAMASVLAYEARASAVVQGIGKAKPRSKKLYRF